MHNLSELTGAYLRRLGVEAEPPSADALFRLHRAHVERVPYETTWIHLGERWSVDQSESARRIALGGRGGYCFHLNGAFATLLTELGYQVSLHVGGVHRGEPDPAEMTNHLALLVSDLPAKANPDGRWYVDTGLGDALHEPLPLIAGTYDQGPTTFVLTETPGGVGDWHLAHDPGGSFTGMAFGNASALISDFAQRHRYLSTSPDSPFVRTITIQRRDATTITVLRGLRFRTIDLRGATTSVIEQRDEWFSLLADQFGLALSAAGPTAVDALWRHANTSHEVYLAALAVGQRSMPNAPTVAAVVPSRS